MTWVSCYDLKVGDRVKMNQISKESYTVKKIFPRVIDLESDRFHKVTIGTRGQLIKIEEESK